MTNQEKNDVKTALITIMSSAVVGIASAYITATTTLTRLQATQEHSVARIASLEKDQRETSSSLSVTTAELRVLNERLKRLDDIGNSFQRLEDQVNSLIRQDKK